MLRSRRGFIRDIAFAGMAASLPPARVPRANSAPPASADLHYLSAVKLARLIRRKEISSEEAVRACLKRIEQVNPRLNAVCCLEAESALKAAREADLRLQSGSPLGPLHGVPMTIKDSFDTAGVVSTAGTTGRSNYIPKTDAFAVAQLHTAGAILLGKTNTPELTLSYETDNLVYGRTNNPWDLARTPGGSSGGAAAILAVGGSAFDLGSDTAGSIRVPAHFCGVAGFKPTFGRVSRSGHIIPPGGIVGRQTHVGPMARFVEDLSLLFQVISGLDPRDPQTVPMSNEDSTARAVKDLRVAYFISNGKTDSTAQPTAEIAAAIRAAAKTVAATGASVEEARVPGFEIADEIFKINIADAGDYYRDLLRESGTTRLHPDTAAYLQQVRSGVVSGRKYADLLMDWDHLKEKALRFAEKFDIILCPAASAAAPLHRESGSIDFSYSSLFNLLGWPAAVVRGGTTASGLPIGIQIVGAPWKDRDVLTVAQHLEQKLGGWKPDFNEPALTKSV